MSANVPRATAPDPALSWLEPGIPAYHVETKCGRYTVSRVTASAQGVVHFIAWRLRRGEAGRVVSRQELDSARVPLDATNDQRAAARRQMQQRCLDDLLSNQPPKGDP